MEKLYDILLDKLGAAGAFLIALATYLVKKELYFQQERERLEKRIDEGNVELRQIIKESLSTTNDLKAQIEALRQELRSALEEMKRRVIK